MTFLTNDATRTSGVPFNLWIVFTNNSNTAGRIPNYTGSTSADVLLWGPQFELNDTATIYEATGSNAIPLRTNFIRRIESQGNHYVANTYDEYTGITSVTNGLILNLDAANTTSFSGTGNWNDISGSGFNAPQNNPLRLSPYDLATSSFVLNNTNHGGFQINQNNAAAGLSSPSFTIETWVRHETFNTGPEQNNIICLKETFGVNGFRFGAGPINGLSTDTIAHLTFFSGQSGGNLTLFAPSAITVRRWYQVVVTYNANTRIAKMYVNGVLVVTRTNAIVFPNANYSMTLGTNSQGCQSMTGNMAVFKWYNRELGNDEVNDCFQGLRNRFGL